MKKGAQLSEILSNNAKEFTAYNINASKISNKTYIKVYSNEKLAEENTYSFNQGEIDILKQVLNNQYFQSFFLNQYIPYDLSFRPSKKSNSLGFSFIDSKDYIYKSPEDIINHTGTFPTSEFISILNLIENKMFESFPNYNPIFMTGLVFTNGNLDSIKAYIRYDLEERPSTNEHCKIIEKVINAFNPDNSNSYSRILRRFENGELIFSFLGVDYNKEKNKRFKLYFRNYNSPNLEPIIVIIQDLVNELDFKVNIKELFSLHQNKLWGVALSSFDFKRIDGIQLYFYS